MTTTRRPARRSKSFIRALTEPPPPPPEAGGPVPPVSRWYMRAALAAAAVLVVSVAGLHFDFISISVSGTIATVAAAATLAVSFMFVRLERRRTELLERSSAALREKVHGVLERDWLTGLITADEFWNVLQREINRSRRYGRECSLLVTDVDLDAFLGSSPHADNADPSYLARHLADLVRSSVRESDTVARRSGVFGVLMLLPETPAEGAQVVAARLQQRMGENPITLLDGRNVPLTLRTVAVSYPSDGDSTGTLAEAAGERASSLPSIPRSGTA